MKEYVAGFLFSRAHSRVALIEKQLPKWMKGKLNAVGGHIETGETPLEAMVREFKEEAGAVVTDWRQFCVLTGRGFKVHFFRAAWEEYQLPSLSSSDEGVVRFYWASDLQTMPAHQKMVDLDWLVKMALSMDLEGAESFEVNEVYDDGVAELKAA